MRALVVLGLALLCTAAAADNPSPPAEPEEPITLSLEQGLGSGLVLLFSNPTAHAIRFLADLRSPPSIEVRNPSGALLKLDPDKRPRVKLKRPSENECLELEPGSSTQIIAPLEKTKYGTWKLWCSGRSTSGIKPGRIYSFRAAWSPRYLWSLDPATNEWKFVGGSRIIRSEPLRMKLDR
jgi:hypothetical protein